MTYRSILVAVDLQPGSREAVDYAFALGESCGALVHTIYASPTALGTSREEGPDAAHEREAKQLEAAVAHQRASASMGRCFLDSHEPIGAILRAADTVSADLIIVSARARSGVERVVLGSVAQGVLDEAKAPVLVLRAAAQG